LRCPEHLPCTAAAAAAAAAAACVLQAMVLHVLLGVAQGMEWLHAHGILHGDLKAANCLLTVLPEQQQQQQQEPAGPAAELSDSQSAAAAAGAATYKLVPKVTDFGLSR
jgi:serine/threonine protein kinase